jgi:hypothetical protein
LYNQYLLSEPARGRYRLHDLIREHARTLTARDDPDSERDQATSRLLDYYQYAAETADRHLARYTRPGPAPDVTAAPLVTVSGLATRAVALAWLRTERHNLLGCLNYAATHSLHSRIVSFTGVLPVARCAQASGPLHSPTSTRP